MLINKLFFHFNFLLFIITRSLNNILFIIKKKKTWDLNSVVSIILWVMIYDVMIWPCLKFLILYCYMHVFLFSTNVRTYLFSFLMLSIHMGGFFWGGGSISNSILAWLRRGSGNFCYNQLMTTADMFKYHLCMVKSLLTYLFLNKNTSLLKDAFIVAW